MCRAPDVVVNSDWAPEHPHGLPDPSRTAVSAGRGPRALRLPSLPTSTLGSMRALEAAGERLRGEKLGSLQQEAKAELAGMALGSDKRITGLFEN